MLKPLLEFNQLDPSRVQHEEFHRFLTSTNVGRLHVEVRNEIFRNVFSYYQKAMLWIDSDVSERLSYYFDISQIGMLRTDITIKYANLTEKNVKIGNVVSIICHIFERDILPVDETLYWKNKLVALARSNIGNGVIQRHALKALAVLKDETLISKLTKCWNHSDELVRNRYLIFCTLVNPNNNNSVKYFVEGTKQKNIYARYGLYEVKSKDALLILISYFLSDKDFLQKFIDSESIFKDKDIIIIDNLYQIIDENVFNQLITIIIYAFQIEYGYWAEQSKFIINTVMMLKKYNDDLIFKLIESILIKGTNKLLFRYVKVLSALIDIGNVKNFVSLLSSNDDQKWIALRVFQNVKFSGRDDAIDIYEEGRKYFTKEYKAAEKDWSKQKNKLPESDRLYKEFKHKLEPGNGKYFPDVFLFYLNNAEKLDDKVTSDDKDRLIWLLEDSIFSKFDPGAQKLTITTKDGSTTSYTTNSWISIFGDCINVAAKLNLNVMKYKSQIISYIPFAYHGELEAIFKLIYKIEVKDIDKLLSIYKQKSSDLWHFMPSSFIKACAQYNIIAAEPILREFVDNEQFSKYDRLNALEVKNLLCPDKPYLLALFNKYIHVASDTREIGEKANELLIQNYNDEESLDWRILEIKKRATAFCSPKGVHAVGPLEHELYSGEFANPVSRVKDVKFKDKYLALLLYSLQLLKKKDHWSYATYIWQIVSSYFENLKEYRSYAPLKSLEEFVNKYSDEEGINWFKVRLRDLKTSYINYLGKPTKYINCVFKYNHLKSASPLNFVSSHEFYDKLKLIIEDDLRRWIEGEGAYSLIVGQKIKEAHKQDYEELIQKTIKAHFENILYKNGFSHFEIIREPQLLDGKRVDFMIFYGFLGPIILEIKLGSNSDLCGNAKSLKTKESYLSMQRYVQGYNAKFGILLVLDNRPSSIDGKEHQKFINKVRQSYNQIQNVETIGLRCKLLQGAS